MCKLTFIIEVKLASVEFPLECNPTFDNALVLVPQRSLTGARFSSWCNLFLGNGFVVLIEGKGACVRFPSHAMLILAMHLCL
jgi:hypothetical protein